MSGIRSEQIKDNEVKTEDIENEGVRRDDLNVSTPGQAVTRKIIAGDGVELSETGVDPGTGDVTINMKHNLVHNSGRFYCYTDGRWVTNSDDNYGPTYYQFLESGGTDVNPAYEWEHNGDIILPGQKVKGLYMTARTNNTQVSDGQFSLAYIRPTNANAQASGYDDDGEITVTEIYRGFWRADAISALTPGQAFSGNTNDMHSGFMDTGEFIAPAFGQLRIYFKPVESATGTRYFMNTYAWDVV